MLSLFHSARLGPVVADIAHERQVVTMLLLPGGGPGPEPLRELRLEAAASLTLVRRLIAGLRGRG